MTLIFLVFFAVGSPPRGRGKEVGNTTMSGNMGITPAWAGKSAVSVTPCHLPEDHPRVGGEKPAVAAHVRAQLGSPPRGRGKAQRLLSHSDPLGITPAWAGKSLCGRYQVRQQQDHPRVGGEKRKTTRIPIWSTGSPPRGRGKVLQPLPLRGAATDHPRVGGEKAMM